MRARERRQRGWDLVKRAWLEGETLQDEIRAYDPERRLSDAYEVSVAHADVTADRLRREAARVADYAALLVQAKKIEEEIGQLEFERQAADQALARTDVQWKAAWKCAGITPLSPREMRSWLEAYDGILQRLERIGAQHVVTERLEDQIAEQRAELGRRLAELGESAPAAAESFGQLAERCESVVEALENLTRRRENLETKIVSVGEALRESLQSGKDAAQRLRVWEAEWSEALKPLGVEDGTPPDEALVMLSKVEELFRKVDECDSLEQRIFGIHRDADLFTADVKALIGHVAPEWSGLTSDQAVGQLNADLTRARNAAGRHAQLAWEIEQKRRGLGDAEKEIVLARDSLENLCRQAECAHPDELESREQRSADYQELRGRVRSLEADIVERGGGQGLHSVLQEVEALDIDALTAQIEDREGGCAELKERQAELNEAVGRLRSHLERIDGSFAAAEAAEESQAVLASIRERAEDYVKLRLASLVLRRAIESYRAKNQGPLLARAGDLFARLTLGSFVGLQTDYSEQDEPVLQGVRPDGRVVGVGGMSDGTLDQLYLALRLATLEKYLGANEPMPFIVDDILIRFDDDRARATLDVLADLSKQTQILFFTHHRSLPDMAQRLSDPTRLVCHRLGT